jgi:Zn-finger domain-containing protein
VRRERIERREREERERQAAEQEAREKDIALGNPLLNKTEFGVKRRWDDDVVFKNQARGTEDKGKRKEFINVSSPALLGGSWLGEMLMMSRTCCVRISTRGL